MTTTTAKKKIEIRMSERAPLSIDPEAWPVIASADWFNGQYEFQANYIRRIKVREHADGRRIVHGHYCSGDGGAPIGFRGASGGYLVDWPVPESQRDPQVQDAFDADTIRAIRRVAGIIGDDDLAGECIADLPARELA
jgi:hypothetical protein